MTPVHVVVPEGVDDPARPSGGNAYDLQVCRGLAAIGWTVRLHAVPGRWPLFDAASHAALADAVRRIPDGTVVLLDGLVASTAPEVLVPEATRLRLVALVHMPLGRHADDDAASAREGAVLGAAAAVITTSDWTRRLLMEMYSLPDERVHAAWPGVDAADLAPGTADAGALLCVAAVTPGKGHDVLLDALAAIDGVSWRCRCVGSLDRDPAFAEALGRRVRGGGLGDRVCFAGPLTGAGLDQATAPPTCWCCRRARRRTAWSSPRRWPAACRWSPPTSAECPRPSVATGKASRPGCWCRRMTRPR